MFLKVGMTEILMKGHLLKEMYVIQLCGLKKSQPDRKEKLSSSVTTICRLADVPPLAFGPSDLCYYSPW